MASNCHVRWVCLPMDWTTECNGPHLIVDVLQLAGTIPALTRIAFCLDLLVFRLEFVELQIAQVFDIDHLIARLINGADELVELQIDRPGVTILRVLYAKNHEEGDDGSAGVNDELPCVGVVEDRTECGQRMTTSPAPANAHLDPSQLEAEAANLPNQSFVVRVCTSIEVFFIRVSSISRRNDSECSYLPNEMHLTSQA